MIVLHAPKEEEVSDLSDLLIKLQAPAFVCYVFIVIAVSLLIIFQYGPLYGNQNVAVYIILCSSIGSLTVMSCKGLGLALRETILGVNEIGNWLTWMFLFNVIFCVTLQMNYLNKSLDLFNTSIVSPVYYVFFTTLVITASAILFREWGHMKAEDILGSLCGFFTVIVAIFLLNAFKDMDISYDDVRHVLKPKREIVINTKWDSRDEERLMSRAESENEHSYGSPGITRTV